MKRILILTEQGLVSTKLLDLYHALYGHAIKELILCTIELSHCRNNGMTIVQRKPILKLHQKAPNPLRSYFVKSKPKMTLNVKNCKQVIDLINKEQINTVIIPIYLYDKDKAIQLNSIVEEIKKNYRIEVIGIYV